MKFKLSIPNKALLEAVDFVSKAADKRSKGGSLEILTHLYFSFLPDGSLSLIAGDLENELEYRINSEIFECDVDTIGLKFTLPVGKFESLLKSAPQDSTAKISNSGKDEYKFTLTFSGLKSSYIMNGLPPEDYPNFNVGTKDSALFEMSGISFVDLVASVQHAMANQDVRYYLNGVKISGDGENLLLAATDGHRLAQDIAPYTNNKNADQFDAILPRKGVLLIPSILGKSGDQVVTFALSQNHFMAKVPRDKNTVVIKSKLVDGRFPDIERVKPKHFNQVVRINRKELLDCTNRASILSNEKFNGIRLNFKGNELTLECSNPVSETATETLEAESTSDLEISVNVKYLVPALSSYTSEIIALHLNDENTAIVLTSEDTPNHINVVMPMRA